jgi:DNA sulfur modification protein DndD
MDTPLARISKEPRINIVKKLPDYLKGKQVIFLLTEEEYTEEIRNKIKKSIGIEYKISFKESPPGCESKVVPYEK